MTPATRTAERASDARPTHRAEQVLSGHDNSFGSGGPYPESRQPNAPAARRLRPPVGLSPPHNLHDSSTTSDQSRSYFRSDTSDEGETAVIEVRGLTKRYGDVLAVDDLSFDVEPGHGHRLPRAERRGQVHDDADGARPRPAHAGQALVNGRPFATFAEPLREVGALLDPGSVHPGRTGRNHLRVAARTNGIPRAPGRRGDRAGRPRQRRPPADQGLLAGHAPAARDRGGTARRPAGAAVRRADQRPRPRRRPLDPRAAAPARRRGPHGAGLQPPDERDAADRRPAGRHRSRPADRRRDDERRSCAGWAVARCASARRTRRARRRGCRSTASRTPHRRRRGCTWRTAAPRTSATSPTPSIPLHHLSEVQQSLEDAYLELTERQRGVPRRARRRTTEAVMDTADRVCGRRRLRGRVFARTCAAEWTRLWTVKATWWFLAAAAVVMVGLGTIAGFEAADDPCPPRASRPGAAPSIATMPAQFALLALALIAVTADYATGGIVPTLQWTPRRTVLFLARTARGGRHRHGLGVLLASRCAARGLHAAAGHPRAAAGRGPRRARHRRLRLRAPGRALAVGLGLPPPQHRRRPDLRVPADAGAADRCCRSSATRGWATSPRSCPGPARCSCCGEQVAGDDADVLGDRHVLAWAGGALLLGWLRLVRDDANR